MNVKKYSFLVVDDNPVALRELTDSLTYLGHPEVEEAHNGSEAWAVLKIRTFDCVIAAWDMPEMSGLALLRILRDDDRHLDLPYFLTDSAFTREKVIDAGRAGVSGLIVKPFELETLRNKIENLSQHRDTGVPENVRASYDEGMKLLEAEHYEEALQVFEQMIDQSEDPEVYYNIGYIKTVQERYADAIAAFRKATELDRYFAKAYEAMGRAFKALGREQEAAESLRQAAEIYMSNEKEEAAEGILNEILEENPDTINVYNTLGVLYRKRGDYQAALQQYEKALKIHPNQPKLHYNIGRLHVDLKDLERARIDFEKALALDPSFKDAREALDAIELGRI
jgi:tetratricopeptide (TPR) repeat protein